MTQVRVQAMEIIHHLTGLQEQEVDMAAHILHLPLEPRADVVVAELTMGVEQQVLKDLQVVMEVGVLGERRVVAAWEAQASQPLDRQAQVLAVTA